jgi:hypothetical protein
MVIGEVNQIEKYCFRFLMRDLLGSEAVEFDESQAKLIINSVCKLVLNDWNYLESPAFKEFCATLEARLQRKRADSLPRIDPTAIRNFIYFYDGEFTNKKLEEFLQMCLSQVPAAQTDSWKSIKEGLCQALRKSLTPGSDILFALSKELGFDEQVCRALAYIFDSELEDKEVDTVAKTFNIDPEYAKVCTSGCQPWSSFVFIFYFFFFLISFLASALFIFFFSTSHIVP